MARPDDGDPFNIGWNAGVAAERERCAALIAGYTSGQIRMAAGEMTAQEMRTVQAVQRWWATALRIEWQAKGSET